MRLFQVSGLLGPAGAAFSGTFFVLVFFGGGLSGGYYSGDDVCVKCGECVGTVYIFRS